ncbi:uncharacterized protein HMPREF1541_06037 [Cyphellophora europaea CBS 101466]|uniref:Uncharacterized protein n=1 Tax=Cyphellophora europaea (strain CBS 101466) TaxID=1220924 RepID=W2RTH5_CYPE1|nr:uncharacterized protein HMPREF1541_06037 [Cyphellophora europaea CBS 101466]ETN39811.1 hypothetical protein HMPREF1541_06037 [Cyphellophora europaea CBS 101466]
MSDAKDPVHRIHAPGSVQALALDNDILFAGLQGGIVAAYSLDTFELVSSVQAHEESVLGLHLCSRHDLLFSTGADSIVNVWSTQSLQPLYSLHSHFEVGDIFCISYSYRTRVAFFGAQNGSIGWYQLHDQRNGDHHNAHFSPGTRKHRFFDSLGPGGSQDPLQLRGPNGALNAGGHRATISSDHYHAYGHKSYVYSMLLVKGLFQHDDEEEVLITGGGGGTIKLWKIEDLNNGGLLELFKFKNKDSSVLSLSYSGTFLYAGMSNGFAHIYNLSSCQLVQKLNVGYGHVSQIQISCGSIVCGTSAGWLKQYNSQFAETACWKAHDGKILASDHEHMPTRKIFATGGNDNTIALWDTKDPASKSVAQAAQSDDDLLRTLRKFVTYRTVSSSQRYARECHEAVNFLRKLCSAFGATTTLLSPGEGVSPILLAKFTASVDSNDSKNVLFYGHYDVVDAEVPAPGSTSTWNGDPFNIEPLNGFFYGRGVSDNKGPILAAVYAAADLAQRGLLSCNVSFLLEGDEEAGSRGFRPTVQQHHEAIGPVDHILLSNSYWLDDHIPCLTFGMRGVVHATIQIASDRPDLHSGMDGKSVQHEPLKDLTVLLGSLLGGDGTEITIPGFDNAIDKLTDTEANVYKRVASSLLEGHPEIKSQQEFAQSLMQRWRYPNLTIHQISVPEAKTAVTISRVALATLSIRIVPSQTAEDVAQGLTRHLEDRFAKLGGTNKLSIGITSKADPWLGNPHSPLFQALRSAIVDVWSPATEAGGRSFPNSGTATPTASDTSTARPPHRRASVLASHGTFTTSNTPHEPLFIREGGSIPAISFLEREFGADAAMFPMGQASDNAHLDNERIRVENLYKGREVLKKVFAML